MDFECSLSILIEILLKKMDISEVSGKQINDIYSVSVSFF